uniref:Putative secreted protein n=1 Tax=Ixodes ricinus TaxID=34613 RepID=A0A6B0UQ15_IXORI
MASLSNWRTTSKGTRSPFFMISLISLPLSVPACTSSRRRSPDEMCVKSYFFTIFMHWVPLPDPGPPKTNTTGTSTLSGSFMSSLLLTWWFRGGNNTPSERGKKGTQQRQVEQCRISSGPDSRRSTE